MHNPFLVICGPTGVGKSDLSIELAKKLPIEVVNCDIGQFYNPLAIGTAKPDLQTQTVPHHLFDLLPDPGNLSVSDYRALLIPLMQEIRDRGNVPVLVGGSLFYIKSLFFPPIEQDQPLCLDEDTISHMVDTRAAADKLWDELYMIDPVRAQSIAKNDPYRLARALTIWKTHGILPSSLEPKFQPLGDFHITFVTRDRAELYDRINQRVIQMFEIGWVNEVFGLSLEWKKFLQFKKLIGYSEILDCLNASTVQECQLNAALINKIQKKTRNYAKRQLTFWRTFNEQLDKAVKDYSILHQPIQGTCQELNLTLSSVDLYLKHVLKLFDLRG